MDAKLTLSLDSDVINNAKLFAEKNNISLSRLTEFLYRKLVENSYSNLEELPISDWVMMAADGQAEYKTKTKTSKKLRSEYFDSKKTK
ncbi:MAG: hypothetical protein KA270_20455 [Saprospiraceae bacterium]|nr:hypothetical protein [Saprospiraceae bacterium]MBP6569559.1 hypothetical protein [Saprospiraceae bacterium]